MSWFVAAALLASCGATASEPAVRLNVETIVIPAIDLIASVTNGGQAEIDAGHVVRIIPSWYAAHRHGPFARVPELQTGDTIELHHGNRVDSYVVYERVHAARTDRTVQADITLQTSAEPGYVWYVRGRRT